MSWPWASPEATRRGLADRVKRRHPGPEVQRRLYEVAFRRVLARLEAAEPSRWVLKGGVALLLRLDPNRTSDDIDIAYLDAAGQHGVALAALERALALDLGDHSSLVVLRAGPEQRYSGLDETTPLRVEARIGGRRWVEFGIDLGYTEDSTPTEPVLPREDLTGLAPGTSLAQSARSSAHRCGAWRPETGTTATRGPLARSWAPARTDSHADASGARRLPAPGARAHRGAWTANCTSSHSGLQAPSNEVSWTLRSAGSRWARPWS